MLFQIVPLLSTLKEWISSRLFIEDDVWIRHGVSLLKGVRIGRRSCRCWRCWVSDVEPYTIVGGAPTRIVGRRGGKNAFFESEDAGFFDYWRTKIRDDQSL